MRYAKFEMDGKEIRVEIDPAFDDGSATIPGRFKTSNAKGNSDSQPPAAKLADAMREAITPNAAAILSACRSNGADPDEIEISFGLKAGAEGGLAFFGIAKATAEANYSVTITWKKKES